ncbi:MAG: hypothetical protein DCC65_03295 [Planctomycetota bacterium]|nr:MAG: hypothetical protein DCC65_03295 [Planctomycetota bacterium]
MSTGRGKKDRKQARRDDKKRQESRRREKFLATRAAPAEYPLARIDPISMSLLRDEKEHSEAFWANPEIHCAKDLRELGLRWNTAGQFLSGEEAQEALEPAIDELIGLLNRFISRENALRLFLLLRGSLRRPTVGSFLDGHRTKNLPFDRHDLRNVISMLELALSMSARDNEYFETFGIEQVVGTGPPSELLTKLPKVPSEAILALRTLLDIGMVLFLFQKAYYWAGHGAHVNILPNGMLAMCFPSPEHRSALEFQRLRDNEQEDSLQHLVRAGFPGRLIDAQPNSDSIFVMRKTPADYAQFMSDIRAKDPSEFNALNFAPAWIDLSVCFDFLRRMGEGDLKKINDLTYREIIACVRAFSEIGQSAFDDSESRYWLGCYGCFPIARWLFEERMVKILRQKLGVTSENNCLETLVRFERVFQLDRGETSSLSQGSPVLKFASLSNAWFPIERGEGVLLDFLDLPRDLARWLGRLRLDGIGENSRGRLFESWLATELDRLERSLRPFGVSRATRFGDVFTTKKRPHTDIDVIWALPPYLLPISCKNFDVSPEEARGVHSAITTKWSGDGKVSDSLAIWDGKMTELFRCPKWRDLNNRLAELAKGCRFAIPVLVSPRVEWIPTLRADLMLHRRTDGKSAAACAVPRICTFDDLRRLGERGGPKPPSNAGYVIELD